VGFADSVKISADKLQAGINVKIGAISQELFSAIVENTPVNQDPLANKRGELKNNWCYGEGVDNYNTSYSLSFDESGIASLSQAGLARTTEQFNGKDGAVSLTNSVPYGYLAEVTGWISPTWSGRVGPYAMIRNSMIEVISKYK